MPEIWGQGIRGWTLENPHFLQSTVSAAFQSEHLFLMWMKKSHAKLLDLPCNEWCFVKCWSSIIWRFICLFAGADLPLQFSKTLSRLHSLSYNMWADAWCLVNLRKEASCHRPREERKAYLQFGHLPALAVSLPHDINGEMVENITLTSEVAFSYWLGIRRSSILRTCP